MACSLEIDGLRRLRESSRHRPPPLTHARKLRRPASLVAELAIGDSEGTGEHLADRTEQPRDPRGRNSRRTDSERSREGVEIFTSSHRLIVNDVIDAFGNAQGGDDGR